MNGSNLNGKRVVSRLCLREICAFSVPFFLIVNLYASAALAAGQLMIAPTRVVFEERDRAAQINIVNTGIETETYRISFVEKVMSKNGDFITIDKKEVPGKYSSDMLRYSPRQVILPPGKSQTIRLMLRRPKSLESGEYRSHLYFQNVPKNSNKSIDKLTSEDQSQVKIELKPIVGITIPIIVRHGKMSVESKLDNVTIIKATEKSPRNQLAFRINRNGNQSVYGDLKAKHITKDGKETVIGRANGVAVYTNNTFRNVRMALETDISTLQSGKVVVSYRERPENGGKLLSQAELLLQ